MTIALITIVNIFANGKDKGTESPKYSLARNSKLNRIMLYNLRVLYKW